MKLLRMCSINFFNLGTKKLVPTTLRSMTMVSVVLVTSLICLYCITPGFTDVYLTIWKVPVSTRSTLTPSQVSRQQDHASLDDVTRSSFKFEDLRNRLVQLLKSPSDVPNPNYTNPCDPNGGSHRACKSNCSRQLSDEPEVRLWDLLTSSKLTLTDEQLDVVSSLTESLPANDVIVISASSANHYNEMQAMFHNLHTVLVPRLDNVSLVLFDIGLTDDQREMTEKHCKCRVLNFPFEKFPFHISERYCYAWKPLIVLASMQKARKMLIYQDASIRWTVPGLVLVNRTEGVGLQLYRSFRSPKISSHTVKKTFDYFGEEPCAFTKFPELQATFAMFKRDVLIAEAVLKPWARCALEDTCMCPALPRSIIGCAGQDDYHKCHRFDQSALGLITGKLFNEDLYKFTVPNLEYIGLQRGHQMPDYFNST